VSYDVAVLCRPEIAAGFALAGLRAVEAATPADGSLQFVRLAARPEIGVILVEEEIYRQLGEDTRREMARRPLPMIVPFPGPTWAGEEARAEEYIVELLRRAIGYRVRLR
jgi:vacuolar-type H+-ATPase subunit F/Vma7